MDDSVLVIDPLDNIFPVLDRQKIQLLLQGLLDLSIEGHHTIRAPHFLKVIFTQKYLSMHAQ